MSFPDQQLWMIIRGLRVYGIRNSTFVHQMTLKLVVWWKRWLAKIGSVGEPKET